MPPYSANLDDGQLSPPLRPEPERMIVPRRRGSMLEWRGAPIRGMVMRRYALLAAILIAMLPSAPSFAVSQKDKMATCKFGADDQKLQGSARSAFLKKCMANRDDPRGPAPSRAVAPPPPKQ